MDQTTSPQWREVRLGPERMLSRRIGEATLCFGRGPAAPAATAEERVDAVASALAPGVWAVHWAQQVHGRQLLTVADREDPGEGSSCLGSGDGLLTRQPGVAVAVWTADCVPVLLVAEGAVAAVHAGWRGIAAGVVEAAVERLHTLAGGARSAIQAAVGPAVGPCHYPVGEEVVRALASRNVAASPWRHQDRVDLRALVRGCLIALGVTRVELVGGCTACDPYLASYRRDGERAGRNLSLVFLD
jgi:YfiH family protein